jgi:hypothetical protein
MNRTLQQHINDNLEELNSELLSSQRRRHLEDELNSLEKYQVSHPDTDHDPTGLELYCNENPEAPECRVYED